MCEESELESELELEELPSNLCRTINIYFVVAVAIVISAGIACIFLLFSREPESLSLSSFLSHHSTHSTAYILYTVHIVFVDLNDGNTVFILMRIFCNVLMSTCLYRVRFITVCIPFTRHNVDGFEFCSFLAVHSVLEGGISLCAVITW